MKLICWLEPGCPLQTAPGARQVVIRLPRDSMPSRRFRGNDEQ